MSHKFQRNLASFLFGVCQPFNVASAAGAYQGALEGPWGGTPKGYNHHQEAYKAAAKHGAPENFKPAAAVAGALLGIGTGASIICCLLRK